MNRDPANVEKFEDEIEKILGFKPREFQDRAIMAQLLRRDTLVHATTGSGKTLIAAAPHYHPSAKGMVTLLVSPLIALQDEQARRHLLSPIARRKLTIGAPNRSSPLRRSLS